MQNWKKNSFLNKHTILAVDSDCMEFGEWRLLGCYAV
jgi:hypothetical protein